MAFLIVQIRPMGDKRGGWRVLQSNKKEDGAEFRDLGGAQSAVHRLSAHYPAILLLEYNHYDRLEKAYKLTKGQWQKLEILV